MGIVRKFCFLLPAVVVEWQKLMNLFAGIECWAGKIFITEKKFLTLFSWAKLKYFFRFAMDIEIVPSNHLTLFIIIFENLFFSFHQSIKAFKH